MFIHKTFMWVYIDYLMQNKLCAYFTNHNMESIVLKNAQINPFRNQKPLYFHHFNKYTHYQVTLAHNVLLLQIQCLYTCTKYSTEDSKMSQIEYKNCT